MGTANNQPDEGAKRKKVVYLFGAGASQAAIASKGSPVGILTKHLTEEINDKLHALVKAEYGDDKTVKYLVNEVIDTETDVEHLITFLEESGSRKHRILAQQFRKVFRCVLEKRLDQIKKDLKLDSAELYATLIDLHQIPKFNERLSGFLTLNYDGFLESAICDFHQMPVDFGVHIRSPLPSGSQPIRVLKLHGSFDWTDEWPIRLEESPDSDQMPLWIPPGIQKEKANYPFSVLWGMARELLDCDILRIVGCNLSSNDWDLVSMLFSTKHAHSRQSAYEIEIIDYPEKAIEIKDRFPYLEPKSLIELQDGVGRQLIGELLQTGPKEYRSLSDEEKCRAVSASCKINNPFHRWLKHKAELLFSDLDSIKTNKGLIERFATS